ncbi:MAG: heavy metal translocating P-type ATPase, partial [Candidatus Bathyarchaeia archaeon]
LQLKIGGMSCSFCAGSIQKAASRLEGVAKVSVSLSHEEALIQYDPSKVKPSEIEEAIRSLGYTIRDPKKLRTFEEEEAELSRERNRLIVSGSLTITTAVLMILMWLGSGQPWFMWIMVSLALVNVFVLGFPILKMAYHSLRRRILNQHVLLEFGAFGGLIGGTLGFFIPDFPISDFFAVAVFITAYHILSGYASLNVRTRSSQAVRKLLSLQPPVARVIRDDEEIVVGIEEVSKDELVRIKPGESIPVDGIVVEGESTVDESLVTGESIPVEKVIGSEVIGGSVNLSGTLKVKVTKIGEESFLRQVARYIEEARAMKPGILQIVDVVLKYYVPGVLIIAAVGFLVWSIGAWAFIGEPNIPRALFAALSALVMGYPCALGMATPLAMIRGGGIAAEKGILIRSSEAFHVMKDLKKIIFDKTGTITEGKPEVVEVVPVNGYGDKDVLMTAASIENVSEHPLAKAIVEKAKNKEVRIKEVREFENFPGLGVKAKLDGETVFVGNAHFLEDKGIKTELAGEEIRKMEERGETVVAVARGDKLMGLIGIADKIKEDAAKTIKKFGEAGLQPILITGDNERTAKAVAKHVGIQTVIAQVLPNQKADKIRELQEKGFRVAMVGDGINDAPALMQSDVGLAIGAGTDIAIESADIIIVGERLSAVADAYYIGRKSYGKTKQNLALAFSFNGIGVPASVTGLVHPIWAMAAMVLSVTTVLLNSFGGRFVPMKRSRELRSIKVEKMIIKVSTMHCTGCVENVKEAVLQVEGIENVQVDLHTKLVEISYQKGKNVETKVKNKIKKLGHVVGDTGFEHVTDMDGQKIFRKRK